MTSLTQAASSPIHEQDAIIINDPLFDHKLDLITAGARPFLKEHLLNKISRENCLTVINYILEMQTQTNLSATGKGIKKRRKREESGERELINLQ
jgi:hypothetical protein